MKVNYKSIRVKYRPWERMDDDLMDEQISDIEHTRMWYAIMRGRAVRKPESIADKELLSALLLQASWRLHSGAKVRAF